MDKFIPVLSQWMSFFFLSRFSWIDHVLLFVIFVSARSTRSFFLILLLLFVFIFHIYSSLFIVGELVFLVRRLRLCSTVRHLSLSRCLPCLCCGQRRQQSESFPRPKMSLSYLFSSTLFYFKGVGQFFDRSRHPQCTSFQDDSDAMRVFAYWPWRK